MAYTAYTHRKKNEKEAKRKVKQATKEKVSAPAEYMHACA